MQTFLPYPDLTASAEVLDDRRLGKQRVETLQILRALTCDGYGWASHPAVTMWRGHLPALVTYGLVVVDVWRSRGYADATADAIAEFDHRGGPRTPEQLRAGGLLPPWWGWPELHRTHRSALLRKDPAWYGPRLPPDTPDDLDYVWPAPPVAPAVARERTAWALRGDHGDDEVAVTLPPSGPAPPRRGTKRARQLERLATAVRPGHLVAVPVDDEVLVGAVAGTERVTAGVHRIPVTWHGKLARADLTRPAALQDPQVVFPLYDEPLLEAAASG